MHQATLVNNSYFSLYFRLLQTGFLFYEHSGTVSDRWECSLKCLFGWRRRSNVITCPVGCRLCVLLFVGGFPFLN